MSDEHKAALAEGRNQSRSVRVYLDALETHKPRRGRKRTAESIRRRLALIDKELAAADPLKRVQLVQEQLDLASELESMNAKVDLAALEAEFVAAARGYSQRKGISYAAWRAVGVPPGVLKKAGISRGS
jgi:hypothetical protein